MNKITKGQLVNGTAEVIHVIDFPHESDNHLQYCLVRLTNRTYQPYVCYVYNTNSGFHHGHYHETLEDAVNTYYERLQYHDIPYWVNYGDVNPIEHGGIWVQKEGDNYRIVKLTFDHDAGKNVLQDLYVDISDTWIEKKSVIEYSGMGESEGSTKNFDILYAIACTDYYSCENFGCDELIYLTLEESEEKLRGYGITI